MPKVIRAETLQRITLLVRVLHINWANSKMRYNIRNILTMEGEKYHYLQSAHWKLREISGINFSLHLKTWEPKAQEKTAVSALSQEERIHLSSIILFHSDPQGFGLCPLTLANGNRFAQFTHSNANLSWKHPHRHTPK